MTSVIRRLLALCACALVLASCQVDVDVDLSMADDGTGTITVVATADAAVVAAVPTLASELALDDVVAAGWELQGPTATADGGLTMTISHSFTSPDEATNLLNSIGPPFNQMSVQRTTVNNDTTTTLHGLLGLSNGFAAFADDDLVTPEALAKGLLFPPLTSIRDVSLQIATAVAQVVFEAGLTEISTPGDIEEFVREHVYEPVYADYMP